MSRPRYEVAETAVLATMGSMELPAETYRIRGRSGVSYDRAQAALKRLVSDGRVVKVKRGWYDLPKDSPYRRREDRERDAGAPLVTTPSEET